VDVVNQVPIRLLHVLEADISQNAGVVDKDIDSAEGIDSGLNDGLAILNRVVVGNCLATCGADLLDDFVGGLYESHQRCPSVVVARHAHVKACPRSIAVGSRQEPLLIRYTQIRWGSNETYR
jgi:hypothetical protein